MAIFRAGNYEQKKSSTCSLYLKKKYFGRNIIIHSIQYEQNFPNNDTLECILAHTSGLSTTVVESSRIDWFSKCCSV